MLAFVQFLEEISRKDLTVPPRDVARMRQRFGDKVLKMGHLQEDASMLLPGRKMLNLLRSGAALVERVGEARERRLRDLVRKFQSESNEADAHRQWKQIEKAVFGVDYPG